MTTLTDSIEKATAANTTNTTWLSRRFTASTNETLRITLAITLCMLLGNLLGFNYAVYLALCPTIIMTKCKDYSWTGLFKILYPTFVAAAGALAVVEIFQDHPFIVWTISLIVIDQLRLRANTRAKAGSMVLPTFNWILIVVFAQSNTVIMPDLIHEIALSMVLTACVVRAVVMLFPMPAPSSAVNEELPPALQPQSVTYQQRLISMLLIGGSLAFLMIVDLLSATFCLVPVIAAATQFSPGHFIDVVERRFITQLGGCVVAVIFSLVMAGHQSIIVFYAPALGLTIFMLAYWMVTSEGKSRDIHGDALLATLLPIQLYMGPNSFGLESTFLRAWELAITLCILFSIHQITQRPLSRGLLPKKAS